jgi:hypothetical protein
MAHDNNIMELKSTYEKFIEINKYAFYRTYLGVGSIEKDIDPIISKIIQRIKNAIKYSNILEDEIINKMISNSNSIYKVLVDFSNHKDNDETKSQFNLYKVNTIKKIKESYEQFSLIWMNVIAIVFESNGYFDLDLSEKMKSAESEFEKLSKSKYDEINSKLEKGNSELQEILTSIQEREEKLKESADQISVSEAQNQFREGIRKNRNQSIFWGLFSAICITIFIIIAWKFYIYTPSEEDIARQINLYKENFLEIFRWNTIYHSVLKITLLVGIGAIATFCLKIFRANMHMYQQNLHRLRIANSIVAFVETATSNDQSDKILQILVESVASFGNSGLIQNEDDHIIPSKMIIDNITKTITNK